MIIVIFLAFFTLLCVTRDIMIEVGLKMIYQPNLDDGVVVVSQKLAASPLLPVERVGA
jgi:hypothetical protein